MRLALVGAGKWGANFMRTIVQSKQDELVLIVSSKNRQELNAIAPNEARLIAGIDQMDRRLDAIDGAIIATPPEVRAPIVEKFLHLGVPVLAEKPLSLEAAESARLVRLARRTGVPLVEDFIHVFSWPFLAIRENITEGQPLRIESAGGNRGPVRSYSPLFDYGPHDLAMALRIFGAIPDRIDLEIIELKNALAFTANLSLDFSSLGKAAITISNISPARVRRFTLWQHDACWRYDDTSDTRLSRNTLPFTTPLANRSPMQLLLEHFSGRRPCYTQEQCWWLSEAVAEVLRVLKNRYNELVKQP